MRLEKYTLECRGFGQRAKRGARILRERTALTKPIEILAISMERVALKPRRAGMGSLKTLAVFGESEATHATIT